MVTRLVASLGVLALLGCSSQPDPGNPLSYRGSGAGPGVGGSGAEPGTGGAGGGGGSGTGPGGMAGTISIDGGGQTDAEGCAKSTATATAQPAILELVIDTSGSMDEDAPGSNDSKWEVTRDALVQALTTIPDGNAVGLFFYPGDPGTGCIDPTPSVPIAVLDATQRQALESRLSNQGTNGGTPTHDAYMVGLNELLNTTLAGNKFTVLITDGEPTYALNCIGTGRPSNPPIDSTPLILQVESAATGGIRTFVIGSPGSEPARADLSRMASVGGTAQPNCSDTGPAYCHFDMTTQSDLATALRDALAAITGQVLSCTYPLPSPGAGQELDLKRVNVRHNGADILKDPSDTECTTGWNYSADKTQILLCGETCNQIKAQGGDIEIVFGCATRVF